MIKKNTSWGDIVYANKAFEKTGLVKENEEFVFLGFTKAGLAVVVKEFGKTIQYVNPVFLKY